jgi:hypothetical protein
VTSIAMRPAPVRGAATRARRNSKSSASEPAAQIQVFWAIVKTPETLTCGVRLRRTKSLTPPPQQIAAKACASSWVRRHALERNAMESTTGSLGNRTPVSYRTVGDRDSDCETGGLVEIPLHN